MLDEKGQVVCRFNNISDLNLLLFNKVIFLFALIVFLM